MLSSRASKTIQKKIDLYEDDLVNFCKELVRIPSVNGLDKEKHVAALVFKKTVKTIKTGSI